MGDLDYVGKRVLRKDGPDKVTGKAVYSVDIQLRGNWWEGFFEAPIAHARILNIDTQRLCRCRGSRRS